MAFRISPRLFVWSLVSTFVFRFDNIFFKSYQKYSLVVPLSVSFRCVVS